MGFATHLFLVLLLSRLDIHWLKDLPELEYIKNKLIYNHTYLRSFHFESGKSSRGNLKYIVLNYVAGLISTLIVYLSQIFI